MVEITRNNKAINTTAGKIELAEDALVDNLEFKKNVAIPYFKDVYKDLQSQSDDKTKGISRVTMLNVNNQLSLFFL